MSARQWVDDSNYLTSDIEEIDVTPDSSDNAPPTVSVELQSATGVEGGFPTAIDPTVTGTVVNADGEIADLLVKVYDTDPTIGSPQPIATTHTNADGRFTYTQEGLVEETTVELWFVVVEATTLGAVASEAEPFTFIFNENQAPVIESLYLLHDTGGNTGDGITSDTTIRGHISHADGSLEGITIEFDDNNDEIVDGVAITDADGNFEYLPVNPGTLADDAERRQITARAVEWDAYQNKMLVGEWYLDGNDEPLPLTYVETENAAPLISELSLKYTPNGDGKVADPAIVGAISNDTNTEGVLVEFLVVRAADGPLSPLNGEGYLIEVSGIAITDADGHFEFVPVGLEPNVEYRIYAHAVEWDLLQEGTGQQLADDNAQAVIDNSLIVTLSDRPLAPEAVTGFGLMFDTGTSADDITADPTIEGTIEYHGDPTAVIVEFDDNNDGTVEGTAVPDENGHFVYVPQKLAIDQPTQPITIRAQVRVPDFSVRSPEFEDDLLNTGWYTDGYDYEGGENGWGENPTIAYWVDTVLAENGDGFVGDWYNSSFTRDWDSLFDDYTSGFDYSVTFKLDLSQNNDPTLVDQGGNPIVLLDPGSQSNHTFSGTVVNDGLVAGLTVVFYVGDSETADGSTTTDGEGNFTYTLRDYNVGENEVHIHVLEPVYASSDSADTLVDSFTITIDDVSSGAIALLRLKSSTGEGISLTAVDPTLVGEIAGVANPALITVEFDYDGDLAPNASALTDGLGQFTFVPEGVGDYRVGDQATVAARVVETRVDATTGDTYKVFGPWSDPLSWHVETNLAPVITQFELAGDAGNLHDWQVLDRVTSDPTLFGRVADDNALAFVTVEFDHDGDDVVDGTAITDENGYFRYTPAGLTAGAWDIRARVVEHDPVTGDDLPFVWAHITAAGDPTAASPYYGFTLVPTQPPAFDTLTHAGSDFDPTLTGKVLDADTTENLVVYFYYVDGNVEKPVGTTTVGADGSFEFTPVGLPFTGVSQNPGDPITVHAKVRKWSYLEGREIDDSQSVDDVTFHFYPIQSRTIEGLPDLFGFYSSYTSQDTYLEPTVTGTVNIPSASVSTGSNQSINIDLVNVLYVEIVIDGEFVTTVPVEAVLSSSGSIEYRFTYRPQIDPSTGTFDVKARPVGLDHEGYVFGDWTTTSFTYTPNLPTIENDAYESLDPTIVGTVSAEPLVSGMEADSPIVEFDFDHDGTADDSAIVGEDGAFNYTVAGLTAGETTIWARAIRYETAAPTTPNERVVQIEGEWQPLTFTLLDARPTLDSIDLLHNIGTPEEPESADPTIAGKVASLASTLLAGMTVEIDQNADGVADARTTVRSDGTFEITPQRLQLGLVSLQVRAIDPFSETEPLVGQWTPFTFELLSIVPELGPLKLVFNEVEGSPTAANPTLTGNVTGAETATRVVVEFDHDGDKIADGSAPADVFGKFTYTPAGLPYGSNTIRARVVAQIGTDIQIGEWDEDGAITFFYRSADPPVISNLAFTNEVDEANGILRGRATIGGFGARMRIEVAVTPENSTSILTDGFATTDSSGAFTYQLRHTAADENYVLKVRGISIGASGAEVAGPWREITDFDYQPAALDLPQLTEFQLAYDPQSTGETSDPTVVGILGLPSAGTVVEFDYDGDGGVDAEVQVQPDGSFQHTISGLVDNQSVTVRARWKQWNPATGEYRYYADPGTAASWTELGAVSVTLKLGAGFNAPATIDDIRLRNNTAAANETPESSDPTFIGQVENDGRLGGLTIKFDQDGNGVADGSAVTRTDGSFVYRAAGLTPSATPQTIRAWVVETAYDGQPIIGPTSDPYVFILAAVAGGTTNTPDITQFTLVEDTGTANDNISSNTTVTGVVGDNLAGDPALVEIDLDGDFDGDVRLTPDANGRFTYRPDNSYLSLGEETTLRARSVAWDAENQQEVFGEWEVLAVTRLADQAPTIVGFGLLNNDTPLTDPTVKGAVQNDGRTAGLRVEFDIDTGGGPDGQADGFAFTDENGYFEFTPYGLTASQEVTVYARVVEWDGDEQAYLPGDF